MNILAMHTLGHDAGACFLRDGQLIYAMEAERLTRVKHESRADEALEAMKRDTGLSALDADLVAVSTNVRNSAVNIPDLDVVMSRIQKGSLCEVTSCIVQGHCRDCLVVAHEASHAALAAHAAATDERIMILVNEGRGTFSRNALFRVQGSAIDLVDHDFLPWQATGFAWSALAALMGYGRSPGTAGTIMALAGYGKPKPEIGRALDSIPQSVLDLPRLEQVEHGKSLAEKIGDLRDFACQADTVATLQERFTGTLVQTIRRTLTVEKTGRLALGGGCALNILTNSAIREQVAPGVAIHPACADAGQALGAAIFAARFYLDSEIWPFSVYSNGLARPSRADRWISAEATVASEAVPQELAERLARGQIIAWKSGASEIGPRALGARSLIASANVPGMRKRLSIGVKRRHWFRPLAPIVRGETFQQLYPGQPVSPHMSFNYPAAPLAAPEATHIDGTARLQTLTYEAGPLLWDTLAEYETLTGNACLINTSLNGHNRPICQTLGDVIGDLDGTEVRTIVDDGMVLDLKAPSGVGC